MISRTIFAISAEESRFSLNGALLVLKERGLAMVATDGHRLAMSETRQDVSGIRSPYRALVPRKAMGEISKLAQEAPAGCSRELLPAMRITCSSSSANGS